ncbi:hypothetical protein ACLI36_29490, partial [Pseudomonas aeruginosa]
NLADRHGAEGMGRTPAGAVERRGQTARKWRRGRGGIEGPQLLAELEGFSGNAGAAKQLLVRLRHDARVKVEVVDGTQVFVWLED